MAQIKVSALTALTSPDGAEELLINDGGTSKKITIDNVTENNFTDALKTKLDAIEANTIEDFMTKAVTVCSGTGYINMCLGSREWENKEGYINNDLFLPKRSRMGVPLEEVDAENSNLITFDKNDANHFRAMVKKESAPANNFEPAPTAGSDFEL